MIPKSGNRFSEKIMPKKRPLSDDERVLWRTVTRAIAPLKGRKSSIDEDVEPSVAPNAAKPVKRVSDVPVAAEPRPSAPPPLAPLDRRMKQRLTRGVADIDGRIDLHGLTQAEAHAVLARFLHQAQARDAKVVLVITGKGARPGSDPYGERGVLKRQVPLWLESVEFRPLVIGFASAGIGHGGQGALYVRVRRGR
jgi:DNA-nicking Smr family endonuclease